MNPQDFYGQSYIEKVEIPRQEKENEELNLEIDKRLETK